MFAHTNITEIESALDLLWRNGIQSKNVVLGIGFYGRSFTMADPSCSDPGCSFSGGGSPGDCTGESGILSYAGEFSLSCLPMVTDLRLGCLPLHI